ncbi:MAG: hypothetical protein LBP68_07425 [Acidobacteriota bacterium]|jgi:hypothetical protein|nr:hypothetical protein [Acidobacteriota bacterium]
MLRLLGVAVLSALLLGVVGCRQQGTAPSGGATGETAATSAVSCDRSCLVGIMKDYLAALVRHDPNAVPLAGDVKFTENTTEIPVGDGLWVTASSGPTDYQVYAADPTTGQVEGLVMMKENGVKDILVSVRLKLVNGKIAEAEHLVVRDEFPPNQLAMLKMPRPGLLEDLASGDKTPRNAMLKAGEDYYVALTGEDGALAPFAADCERHENGMVTAGPGDNQTPIPIGNPDSATPATMASMAIIAKMPRNCEGQLSAGAFEYITDIKNRRVLIADEQKGLVVGYSMFWHRGGIRDTPVKGVPGVKSMPAFADTFNLPAVHIFKVRQGKIHEIEAIGFMVPYGLKSGWE